MKAVIRREFPGLQVDDYRVGNNALTRGVYLYYNGLRTWRVRQWALDINLGAYGLSLEEAGRLYGMIFRYQEGIILEPRMEVMRRIPNDTANLWEMVVTFGLVSDTEFPMGYLPFDEGTGHPAETADVHHRGQVYRFEDDDA